MAALNCDKCTLFEKTTQSDLARPRFLSSSFSPSLPTYALSSHSVNERSRAYRLIPPSASNLRNRYILFWIPSERGTGAIVQVIAAAIRCCSLSLTIALDTKSLPLTATLTECQTIWTERVLVDQRCSKQPMAITETRTPDLQINNKHFCAFCSFLSAMSCNVDGT